MPCNRQKEFSRRLVLSVENADFVSPNQNRLCNGYATTAAVSQSTREHQQSRSSIDTGGGDLLVRIRMQHASRLWLGPLFASQPNLHLTAGWSSAEPSAWISSLVSPQPRRCAANWSRVILQLALERLSRLVIRNRGDVAQTKPITAAPNFAIRTRRRPHRRRAAPTTIRRPAPRPALRATARGEFCGLENHAACFRSI